jgi:HSP20 family protein
MLMRNNRYNPFREMQRMMDMLERDLVPFPDEADTTSPLALDVSSDEKSVKVRAAIPGVKQDDISIEVKDGVLTISGESRYENEEKQENWHRRELRYGKYSRAVRLPEDVNFEKAQAELENGILTVTLPRVEPTPVQKIAVKARNLIEGNVKKN